jgi:hypothetical protein
MLAYNFRQGQSPLVLLDLTAQDWSDAVYQASSLTALLAQLPERVGSSSRHCPTSAALGRGLPSRLRWQHVRCTPDSCRPIASPNSAALGQNLPSQVAGGRALPALRTPDLGARVTIVLGNRQGPF